MKALPLAVEVCNNVSVGEEDVAYVETTRTELCIHRMNPGSCAWCKPRQGLRIIDPARDLGRNTWSRSLKPQQRSDLHVVVCRTDTSSFEGVTGSTLSVHIDGAVYRWVLERIFARGRNVNKITCTPRNFARIGEPLKHLCREQGVLLAEKFERPDLAPDDKTLGVSVAMRAEYKKGRVFLLRLKGGQKELFGELLEMKCPAAMLAARFYCLNNEEPIPLAKLGSVCGCDLNPKTISRKIRAVFLYLDATFATNKQAEKRVARIRRDVIEFRRKQAA